MALIRGEEQEPKVRNKNFKKLIIFKGGGRWQQTRGLYIYFFGTKIKKDDNKNHWLYFLRPKFKNSTLKGGERWQQKVRIILFWNRNKKVPLREVKCNNKSEDYITQTPNKTKGLKFHWLYLTSGFILYQHVLNSRKFSRENMRVSKKHT